MDKIKVIEFIQSVGDGGAETLVKDYALLIDQEHFDVTVVVLHAVENSANYQRLQEKGIPVIALSSQDDLLKKIWRKIFPTSESEMPTEDEPTKGVLEHRGVFGKIKKWIRNKYFGLKFLKIVMQTNAQVIHAHLEVLEILQAIGKQLEGIRLFHTCHNPPAVIYTGEELPAAKYLIKNNGMRIIALHEKMESELNELFGVNNTAVIRNGIVLERFLNLDTLPEKKREEIGIPQEAFVIGHVGRFSEQKNHLFLIEVFQKIAEKNKNAFLLMIGAGNSESVTNRIVEYGLENHYLILSHRQDIPELLSAMDVFIFPSIFEGFGIALLEAQAAGLKCLASDCCPAEVIRTENCIPLPLGDPWKWAQAALDPDLKRETSEELYDYDMNREIRRLEKLYLGQWDHLQNK